MRPCLAAAILVLAVAATAGEITPRPTADAESEAARVAEQIARMSLRDKVGQLLMIGLEGGQVGKASRKLLRDLRPGGISIFRRNVENTRQVGRLLRQIRKVGGVKIAPFLAVDQEGGLVVRLRRGALVLPGAMMLGAADDTDLARRAGLAAGRDLGRLGFNMDLAPVLDVNSQADNPVIGIRAFGDDPDRVAALGVAFARGLGEGGVIAVGKHFPGHGDTPTDSHGALPTVPHDLKRLLEFELKPFRAAIRENACPVVMTAHVALPALEEDGQAVPATLSRRVIEGLLRERLGFSGLVLTDDLGMGALSGHTVGQAAVQALLAGADLLLVSRGEAGMRAVQRAVLRAVRDGTISESRIDESLERILTLKARSGLFPAARVPAWRDGPSDEGRKLVSEIARRGITLLRNRSGALPLPAEGRVLLFSQSPTFARHLGRLRPGTEGWSVAYHMSDKARRALVREASRGRRPERVVVAATNRTGALLARDLAAALEVPVIVVSLGSPYLLAEVPEADAAVAAYSFRWPACEAAAEVLSGRLDPSGKLPVSVPGLAERGTGLRYEDAASGDEAARVAPPKVVPPTALP